MFWKYSAVVVSTIVIIPLSMIFLCIFLGGGDTWDHLYNTVLFKYFIETIILVLGVIIGTSILGISSSWVVSTYKFPGKRIFAWALLLPLAIPGYAVAYSYGYIFEFAGPVQTFLRKSFEINEFYKFPNIRSMGGAIFILSISLYPYVYLLTKISFSYRSARSFETALSLGNSKLSSFFSVALPLARPAIVGGLALSSMETLSDFGTVHYLGVDTLSIGIYRTWFGFGDILTAGRIASILLLLVFLILIIEFIGRRNKYFYDIISDSKPISSLNTNKINSFLCFIICFFPIFFGFILPSLWLIIMGLRSLLDTFDTSFYAMCFNSFFLALFASLITTLVALILAFGIRLSPKSLFISIFSKIACLGYAIPGVIVGVGVLIPFTYIDSLILHVFKEPSFSVLLSGSIIVLIYAYVVRFLSAGFNTIESSFSRIPMSIDDAAISLKSSNNKMFYKIHIPLIKGGIISSALIVFVDVIKELPATLILRPFNFDTLAIKAYELASAEQIESAALPALTIFLLALGPIVLLSTYISKDVFSGEKH